jgi:phosphogluconate dehydratase
MKLDPRIAAVTDAIRQRSRQGRTAYLEQLVDQPAQSRRDRPARSGLGCGNLAHGFAASASADKLAIRSVVAPNLGIVTAYNDMLSAHQPFADYPDIVREAARQIGATAQVAGGVPAMCDGITQGRPGMELSLFSRDVIAQATAVALSHDMFDAAICLGVCDKIVPGLLIGALSFGYLPVIFAPAGPMTSGLDNKSKAEVRERYAVGMATRAELLEAEAASYHSAGTCTFYGTANSNQTLLEAMGLQLPGASFVNPGTPLRSALTQEATRHVLAHTAQSQDYRPIGQLVDERAIVNALVMLLATGGSTNHTIHWIAVARAAGITIDWNDFDAIAHVVPLITHIYPNGIADVNHFQAAGGVAFVVRELLDAGMMHGDVLTMASGEPGAGVPAGLRAYTREPQLRDGRLQYQPAPAASADETVVRPVARPFEAHGGLRLLTGNLGRALIKISAVQPQHRRISAPALVLDDPQELHRLHEAGNLPRDFVAVVRFQGPRANGMPEMHSLAPLLGMLQSQGGQVALVTDGRMSGASGKFAAAIHVTPEALDGGPLARLRTGDLVRLDAEAGRLEALVDGAVFAARSPAQRAAAPHPSLGRSLFAGNRAAVGSAEQGALSISCGPEIPAREPIHA